MSCRFTNLFFSCLLCTICLLETTHAWGQAPATAPNGNSPMYCTSNIESVLATCPARTTLVASSANGIITIEPSALFPNDPIQILPPLSPLGLTTYTIVCSNSAGSSTPILIDATIVADPSSPTIVSNLSSSTVAISGTFSLTAICETGSVPIWDDDNTAGPTRTITAPNSPATLTYRAICELSQCRSQPEQIEITVAAVAVIPGSPTLTFGTSATFCMPTESCGGVFLYNSVVCPVGWLFSYRDPGGLLINTNAQSGTIVIPYAPSNPPVPLRILNYTAICSNPLTGQTASTPLTIYVDNAPPAPTLQLIIRR